MKLFILSKSVEIGADKYVDLLEMLLGFRQIVLPPTVKNYLKTKFEGRTKQELEVIETDSFNTIQELINSGAVIPYLSEEDCIAEMEKYTHWAISEKCKYQSLEMPDLAAVYERLNTKRGANNSYFLNILDLLALIPKGCIPQNFVVWVDNRNYGNICVAYSEFNKQYKYLAIFK